MSHLLDMYSDPEPPVVTQVEVEHVELDLDTAVACGLIVNELVSNALKHAFPPDSRQARSVWRSVPLPEISV